jgi:EAL domain-containing protein (putative c-di-GMP-specific phosphodiesterase class I)
MVSAIVSLARNLGMDAVAEGVETAEQLAQLASLAVNTRRGYYFSGRSMDAAGLIALQPGTGDPRCVRRPISETAVPQARRQSPGATALPAGARSNQQLGPSAPFLHHFNLLQWERSMGPRSMEFYAADILAVDDDPAQLLPECFSA